MAEYGDGRSTSSRNALSAISLRFIDEYFSLVAAAIRFCHINFCHEKTTVLRHPNLSNANAWEGNDMHVKRSDPHPHEGTQIVCTENSIISR